tara:strand:- start:323 stop:481 length:159 start_codon:yes stop_codon:yes gene_type:complete
MITRGVSIDKVVATIEVPKSHQELLLLDKKYESILDEDSLLTYILSEIVKIK